MDAVNPKARTQYDVITLEKTGQGFCLYRCSSHNAWVEFVALSNLIASKISL